eukprot:3419418-Prymnesium_polylepis.2
MVITKHVRGAHRPPPLRSEPLGYTWSDNRFEISSGPDETVGTVKPLAPSRTDPADPPTHAPGRTVGRPPPPPVVRVGDVRVSLLLPDCARRMPPRTKLQPCAWRHVAKVGPIDPGYIDYRGGEKGPRAGLAFERSHRTLFIHLS